MKGVSPEDPDGPGVKPLSVEKMSGWLSFVAEPVLAVSSAENSQAAGIANGAFIPSGPPLLMLRLVGSNKR